MLIGETKEMENALKKAKNGRTAVINGMSIKIKNYVSIVDKINISKHIIENSLNEKVFDHVMYEIVKDIYMVLTYTNIEFSDDEDIIEFYDLLQSSGFKEKVFKIIPEGEIEEFNKICDAAKQNKLDDISTINTPEGVFGELIASMQDISNSLLVLSEDGLLEENTKQVTDALNNMDVDKLKYVNKFMEVVENEQES